MIQNGKKPLSEKPKVAPMRPGEEFGNMLGVEPAVLEEIKKKNLDYRFINAKQLMDMGGYHAYGWRPIKIKEIGCDKVGLDSFQFGNDPEGYIRRGDVVLAVRPKEVGDKHRAYLKSENERLTNMQKIHAEEMRSLARRSGINLKVHEGYEDNE